MRIKLFLTLLFLLSINAAIAQHCVGREPVFFGGTIRCSDAPYKLVFFDDFDGSTIDTNKWYTYLPQWPLKNDQSLFGRTHDINTTPSTFKELQIYKDENVVVSNGTVKLRALKETSEWFGVTKNYSSGYLEAKTPFKYGKIEVRFKLPNGAGFWPAIWLWGSGDDVNGIQKTQEIDILEHCGEDPSKHHITFHYKNRSTNCDATQSPYSYNSVNFTSGFHTIACEFNPQFIKVYCDDILVRYEPVIRTIQGAITNCSEHVGWGTYLFSNFTPTIYQSLIMNLALSSANNSYCDPVDNHTPFPAEMEIDYVKIWQQHIQPNLVNLTEFSNHLKIFPNPASSSFNIDLMDDYQVSIINCKIYHSISAHLVSDLNTLQSHNQFDCSGWNKGVYVVYFKLQNNQSYSQLIVIQ